MCEPNGYNKHRVKLLARPASAKMTKNPSMSDGSEIWQFGGVPSMAASKAGPEAMHHRNTCHRPMWAERERMECRQSRRKAVDPKTGIEKRYGSGTDIRLISPSLKRA